MSRPKYIDSHNILKFDIRQNRFNNLPLHIIAGKMFLHLLLSIFIYYANTYDCGGWGILARKVSKEDGFELTCPNNEHKVLINATRLCCIPQPDCPPGLVPETPQDPDKYYDRSLEIGCRVAPETTSKQTASQAWDRSSGRIGHEHPTTYDTTMGGSNSSIMYCNYYIVCNMCRNSYSC